MSVQTSPTHPDQRLPVDPALIDRLVGSITASPTAPRVTINTPITAGLLVELPQSSVDDVAAAFAAARTAQRTWAARPVRERVRVLNRIHDLILDRRSEVCDLIQAETGKPRKDAFFEVADVALAARYAARMAPRLLQPRRRVSGLPLLTRTLEIRHPKGVVGVISPWNYPLTLAISDSLPAFVTGNAVVHKPDNQVTLTALWTRNLAIEAGLPEGLWQIVTGPGPEIGGAVVARADYVSFTGSTATGRVVAREVADRLVGASLELGGKNPLIVLADADLDRAAAGAIEACFSNSGQLCVSMERLLVAEEIRDEFLDRFLRRVGELRLGGSFDYSCDIGPLVSPMQLDKVTAHVEDAVTKGAQILAGGKARPDVGPNYFEPTVLTGTRPGMLVHDEETFGPVVSVFTFRTEDEAVQIANDTPYGLNASVWTRDSRHGVEFAKRLHKGSVNINEGYAAVWASHDVPIGGWKASGLGRRHGREGILRYTESQAIAVQRLHNIAPPGQLTWDSMATSLVPALKALRRLGRR